MTLKVDDGCGVEHTPQMYEAWMMGHSTERIRDGSGGVRRRWHSNNRWWCIGGELLGCDSCISAGTHLPHHLPIYSSLFFVFKDGVYWFREEEVFSGRSAASLFFSLCRREQTDRSWQRRGDGGAECKHHWQSHEICISYRGLFGMEARAMNETHIACKTGPLHRKQSMLRPRRTILIHPALPFPPLASSTRSQNRKRFGLRRWRWAAWCRTRSAGPGSAGQSVPAGSACGPRCPRGAFLAAMKNTKVTSWDQRTDFPGISIADLEAGRRGLWAHVGEETGKVNADVVEGQLSLWGCSECRVPTYHIHQSHIKEHASCDGEDPARDIVRVLAHSCANQHADIGHEGGQQIVDNGLLHRHPGFQQHRKVTCQPEETHTHSITAFPIHPLTLMHMIQHTPIIIRLKHRL